MAISRQPALSPEELDQLETVWKAPGLVATLISVFCAFGGWSLLLPVIPLAVIQQGGSDSLAGLSTGVFMGATVITQAFTPWMIRRVGFPAVMAFAGLMLGLPALFYVVDMSAVPLLVVAVIRGIGFGAVTVAEAALIAELVPPRMMGNSSAALGVSVGLSQLLSFPLGLWLLSAHGEAVVFVTAAVYASVGAAAAYWIPYRSRAQLQQARRSQAAPSISDATSDQIIHGPQAHPPQAATWKLAAVPGLAIGAIATGFAAFSTFLAPAVEEVDVSVAALVSAAGLSVLGGLQMLGRVLAGRVASRSGQAGRLAATGLGFGIAGLLTGGAVITFADGGLALVIGAFAAAGLFGFGFGIVQNEALLMLFERLPREKTTLASALWNMTFDSGTGIGAVVLGMVAGVLAYYQTFWIAACIVAVALLAVITDGIIGRRRQWEHNNMAHQLRAVRQRVRAPQMDREH